MGIDKKNENKNKNNKKIEISNKEILKFLFNTSKSEIKFLLIILFFAISATILSSFYPIITKNIVDLISGGDFLDKKDLVWGNFYNLIFILIGLFLGWRITEFCLNIFEVRIMKKIFGDTFKYINRHSYKFFSDNQSGSLVKKLNRLPYSFVGFFDIIVYDIIGTIIGFSFLFYILFNEDVLLFGIFFGFLFLLIGSTYFLQNWQVKFHKIWLKQDSKVGGLFGDVIVNHFNVSIFGKFDKESEKLNSYLNDWYKKGIDTRTKSFVVHSIQWVWIIGFEILITYYSLSMVLSGNMEIGTFVMIELFLLKLTPKFYSIGHVFKNIYRIFADIFEALEILKTPHEIGDIKNAKNLEVKKGEIEFKNVDFKYEDGTKVFDKFNLKIRAGEKVALVGESGAGKTSITQLIFRFFDIQNGEILIDGQDISKVKQDSLRSNISLVPQESILFHRSLKENMVYGNENISEEKFLEISKKTHCHDFISELEKGYDTLVGERGIKLSGGQRQRVSIARAIIENSKIFILDEATSALDSESEEKIQKALEVAMEGKTSIVIAHRLSTIMKMDRIIVLEKGKIIEEGTHDELIKKSGKYKKLWGIQSGGFEK